MLFWFCTKVAGLWMVHTGLWGLMMSGGISLEAVVTLVPAAVGTFLLMSDAPTRRSRSPVRPTHAS